MNVTADEIGRMLASLGEPGRFATSFAVAADDLLLSVDGVGTLRLPVTPAAARKLASAAQPAHHGYKDETRLDRRVRDTGEIAADRLSIDGERWAQTLDPALRRIHQALGLAGGQRLRAELHNLLVYGPGQFFVSHQDSEKADGMVGTLVVSLPSSFSGGEFVVEHHDDELRVRAPARQLGFVAFYADCRHEVRPVERGHRVVLTYNLMLEGEAVAEAAEAGSAALAAAVGAFFETPLAPRWSGDTRRSLPDRLVYLLDHQYTQRGLSWMRLKNGDARRGAALRDVAERLDCALFLAQADVHEVWSCEDEYQDAHYPGYEDDGEEDDVADAPALVELIDNEIELRHWVGLDGSSAPQWMQGAGVDQAEICFTKASVDCAPFESEHQGYMGNWGNTVDRWYHRAAVVMWPRARAFAIRAKASPRWAVGEVRAALAGGDAQHGTRLARTLLPLWGPPLAHGAEAPALFDETLALAAAVDDAALACALLAPFPLIALTPALAPRLADLRARHGTAGCTSLLAQWGLGQGPYMAPERVLEWLATTLPAACQGWGDGAGQALAAALVDDCWAWVQAHCARIAGVSAVRARQAAQLQLCEPLLAVLQASLGIGSEAVANAVVACLITALPVEVALGVLHAARDQGNAGGLSVALQPVHAHCRQMLVARLGMPARAADDWSIEAVPACPCALCVVLGRFLRAAGERRLDWPLAQGKRSHVENMLAVLDVPVRHRVVTVGRPYVLELEKSAALFAREAALRDSWDVELAWLDGAGVVFAVPG